MSKKNCIVCGWPLMVIQMVCDNQVQLKMDYVSATAQIVSQHRDRPCTNTHY